jgi:hypothetical protein
MDAPSGGGKFIFPPLPSGSQPLHSDAEARPEVGAPWRDNETTATVLVPKAFDIRTSDARLCCWGPFRRDRVLWSLHLACCIVHTAFAVACLALGAGKDMQVKIYRIKMEWHPSQDHTYEVVDNGLWQPRMDVLAACFFGLSAVMHAVWVFVGAKYGDAYLWNQIQECFCWWCARAPHDDARTLANAG